jgi:Amt family ammonium transporter
MSDSGTAMMAAHVMMNTTLSAATGGVTVFLVAYAVTKKYDAAALCNGILAGLVSITAGCSNVESGSAVLIGLLGGVIYFGSAALIKKMKIDDPVDASSVHGTCGIWGCLAAALFDFGAGMDKHHGWGGFSATSWTEDGETKYMTTADALTVNAIEIFFVIAWSGGLSAIVFGILRAAKILRVDEEVEKTGCDHECASPRAYSIGENPAKSEKRASTNSNASTSTPETRSRSNSPPDAATQVNNYMAAVPSVAQAATK